MNINTIGGIGGPANGNLGYGGTYSVGQNSTVVRSGYAAVRFQFAHTAMEAFLNRTEGYILTKEELVGKAWDFADAMVEEAGKRGHYL